MRTVAVIQARMGSSRLPGKALADLDGKPVIQHVLERASAAEMVDEVVLATTWLEEDDILAAWAKDNGYRVFQGHSTDVLHRLRVAADWAKADVVVRVTGDCPRLESGVIDKVIRTLLNVRCDYASNIIKRTYPKGLDCEAMWMETLVRLDRLDTESDRGGAPFEFLETRPDLFLGCSVEGPEDHSDINLCVDTADDLERLRMPRAA